MDKMEEGMQAVGEMHPVTPLTGSNPIEEKFNALRVFENKEIEEEIASENEDGDLVQESVCGGLMILVVGAGLLYTAAVSKKIKKRMNEIERFYASHNDDFMPLSECKEKVFAVNLKLLQETKRKVQGSTLADLSKYKYGQELSKFNETDDIFCELWYKNTLVCVYIVLKETEGLENDSEIKYKVYIGLDPQLSKYHEYQVAYIRHMLVGEANSEYLVNALYGKIKNGIIEEAAESRITSLLRETGMNVDLFQESSEEHIFFEAGEEEKEPQDKKIDEDIKPIITALNEKGYKTKYSCSGHPSMRVKDDIYNDGVKNGKLYSSARIVFDKVYDLPNIPKYWTKKVFDNGEGMGIYVKPPTFSTEKGMPKEQFNNWKAKYMYQLKQWVEQLPDADEVKNDKNANLTLEGVLDDMALDVLLTED